MSDGRLNARQAAFTLVEVLVALFVVTIGMTAVFMQLNQYARTSTYIRDKTLASWIASNRLTEMSIQPGWPELSEQTDELEFANRQWWLEINVSETDVENLRRVDVAVGLSAEPDVTLQQVSALIEPAPPTGFAPLRWQTAGQEQGG